MRLRLGIEILPLLTFQLFKWKIRCVQSVENHDLKHVDADEGVVCLGDVAHNIHVVVGATLFWATVVYGGQKARAEPLKIMAHFVLFTDLLREALS